MTRALPLLLLLLAGCEPIIVGEAPPVEQCPDDRCCPYKDVPPVDLPQSLRNDNYGGGSCMWAAFQDVLTWQNQGEIARYCRQNYYGAAGVSNIVAMCDKLGLDYAYTTSGDVEFLEWASRTRRGAVVYWQGGAHAVTFCGFVGDKAVVIDNNDTEREYWMSRERFLNAWRNARGGNAVTVVYQPAPPRPWI